MTGNCLASNASCILCILGTPGCGLIACGMHNNPLFLHMRATYTCMYIRIAVAVSSRSHEDGIFVLSVRGRCWLFSRLCEE